MKSALATSAAGLQHHITGKGLEIWLMTEEEVGTRRPATLKPIEIPDLKPKARHYLSMTKQPVDRLDKLPATIGNQRIYHFWLCPGIHTNQFASCLVCRPG